VGLFAAACLAERGIEVAVIDEDPPIQSSAEPLALGPRGLELLDSFALLPALEAAGRRIERVIVHEDDRVPTTVELSKLPAPLPFLLIVPRSVLREVLAAAAEQRGVEIRWGHRLRALANPDGILRSRHAGIDELEHVSGGYAVTTMEAVVKRQSEAIATMVIGADGRESMVRRTLEIDFPATTDPETLAVYDFKQDGDENSALHVILHPNGADVVWPLPGGGLRVMCLVPERDARAHFESSLDLSLEPLKFGEMDPAYFECSVTRRAPWLGRSRTPSSARAVTYQRRRAEPLEDGLVWLGGDAAHLAGPLASQSENLGLEEASYFGLRGASVLHPGAPAAPSTSLQKQASRRARRALAARARRRRGRAQEMARGQRPDIRRAARCALRDAT
jgi:2-polyprenyl-6-methoxyphenol hydroxylase-like FAD-dependent oxidoreductase